MQTTVGQLLINDALPEDMRDYSRQLDGGAIKKLLGDVARLHPEKYKDISKKLSDVGWRSAQESGGYSFGLKHLRKAAAATAIQKILRQKMQLLLDDDNLDDKRREEEIVKLVGVQQPEQQKQVYDEQLAAKNPLAMQVRSKARGNPMNLSSLIGGDLLYADHRDQVIPVPVMNSYSEGLRPWEYWAGTYGARKGVIDLKFATQDAGFLSKQLNQVTHRLVVEDLDADNDGIPDDAENPPPLRGMPVDTDDTDNEGALLAHDSGPYRRNTVLTPKILKHLKGLGKDQILVRSPIVGGTPHGGIYSRDVGVREHGVLPGRGEMPGLAAVQALSEPLTQAQISSKHTGGVAGEGKAISGFDYVNQLVQVPKHFKGGAAHADVDGIVSRIDPGAAGGQFVMINGQKHFAPGGSSLKVKVGDSVEAGDVLSTGLPNPAKVVEHKGIGEGRRYFVKAFRDAMTDAGMPANRRNVELLSRGLINHVRLTDELGDYVPEDVVPYSTLEHVYKPRDDSRELESSQASGKYLERPILHYTIGTKVRPSVMRNLEQFGVKKVHVHDTPPPFQSEMIRGMSSLANDPDWMTRMYGSGLKGSLLRGAQRGATSDEDGTSFVPSLAKAVDFGRQGIVRKPEAGWMPELPAVGQAPAKAPQFSMAVKRGADAPDGRALATGVNPATTPSVLPGGVKPVGQATTTAGGSANPYSGSLPTGGGNAAQPQKVPTPQRVQPPQPVAQPAPQPEPQQSEPEPTAAPWYSSGYQPTLGGPAHRIGQIMLPYAQHLGPLAPVAMMAGMDWNAMGSLTQGKNWSYGDDYTKSLRNPTRWGTTGVAPAQSQVSQSPQTPSAAQVPQSAQIPLQPQTAQPQPEQGMTTAGNIAQKALLADLGVRGAYNAGAAGGRALGYKTPSWTTKTPGAAGAYSRFANKGLPLLGEVMNYRDDPMEYERNNGTNWAFRPLGGTTGFLAGMGHDIYNDYRKPESWGQQINDEAGRTHTERTSANPIVEIPAGVKAMGKLTPTGASGAEVAGQGVAEQLYGGKLQDQTRMMSDMFGASNPADKFNTYGGQDFSGDRAARETAARTHGMSRITQLDTELSGYQSQQPDKAWRIDYNANNGYGRVVQRPKTQADMAQQAEATTRASDVMQQLTKTKEYAKTGRVWKFADLDPETQQKVREYYAAAKMPLSPAFETSLEFNPDTIEQFGGRMPVPKPVAPSIPVPLSQ